MRLIFIVFLLTLTGCAFQNTNPFTGSTGWVIGDACNNCNYTEDGLPTGGTTQAGGMVSDNAAILVGAALAAEANPPEELEEDLTDE